jgi:hypothetical protein
MSADTPERITVEEWYLCDPRPMLAWRFTFVAQGNEGERRGMLILAKLPRNHRYLRIVERSFVTDRKPWFGTKYLANQWGGYEGHERLYMHVTEVPQEVLDAQNEHNDDTNQRTARRLGR